ncbi:hypothetical protein EC957_004102 [Mortierella hygrophila]|uniref:FIST domain-containing protein n=1 Tax=Mortierella hygrophila TaxID=979708 RepID=A0A9P6FJV9_9FUNG|nr:hypothetical protein EC957_004102 [Mortierella hygrophila]
MNLSRSFTKAVPFATTTTTTHRAAGTALFTRTTTALGHRLNQKTLWTAATSSHPDLATALSQCLSSSSTSSPMTTKTTDSNKKSGVTIILASRSYPGSDLLTLPSRIPDHISQSRHILGAVVDRVPTPSGHGVSTLTLTPATATNAASDRLVDCQPFYLSSAESRRKRLKEKSVGKWARSQDIEERSLDTADAWSSFKSISIGRNQVQVPTAALPPSSSTASASGSNDTDQDIVMISDLEVHQFLEALDSANPAASKVGLMASSTPFITGRPVTMFYDGQLVQDGVLGVSILKRPAAKQEITNVTYPSMSPLGPAMQITRCRGNIILELDESNATRLLLDRLQATTLTKDKEYFLATGEPTAATSESPAQVDMSKATVYKITGGDPSKGNMAVDTVHDLQIGQWVQFIHHGQAQDHGHIDNDLSSSDIQTGATTVRFTATDPNNTIEEQESAGSNGHHGNDTSASAQPRFGGSSENGFIVGQPNQGTWVCAVTDSILKHTL